VLAGGHDQQKKTVSLNFLGTGRRAVKVGYVVESPVWKTSYRLALEDGNKAFLQGWAVVENTSDEDWNQVRLGLISGRPISFPMDLHEPLSVPRPKVEPELFASLRPQTYSGDMNEKQARRGGAAEWGRPQFGATLAIPEAAPAPAADGFRTYASAGQKGDNQAAFRRE